MPFLSPNQQRQSTEGTGRCLWDRKLNYWKHSQFSLVKQLRHTAEKVDVAADSLQLVDEYDKEAVGSKHRRIDGALIVDDDVAASVDVHQTVAAQQLTDTQLHAHATTTSSKTDVQSFLTLDLVTSRTVHADSLRWTSCQLTLMLTGRERDKQTDTTKAQTT